MKKPWRVEITSKADRDLRCDFQSGKLSSDDIKVIKRWISDVEELGLEFAQSKPDWRDHELVGRWKCHRAISFSYSGRVIYKVEDEKVVVRVVRVSSDYDYRS